MKDLMNSVEVEALQAALNLPERSGPMGSVSKKSKVTAAFTTLSIKVMAEGLTFDDVLSKKLQKEVTAYLVNGVRERKAAMKRLDERDQEFIDQGLHPLTGLPLED